MSAELGEFQVATNETLLRDLLPEEHRYTGAYFSVAWRAEDEGYTAIVVQTGGPEFLDGLLTMQTLHQQGFSVRGVRSTSKYLDQDMGTWLASRNERYHEAVDMVSPNGDAVEVDAAIAPVIQALWERGVTTVFSCQGGHATPTGPAEGNMVYERGSRAIVLDVLRSARFTNLVVRAIGQGDREIVEFDPVE